MTRAKEEVKNESPELKRMLERLGRELVRAVSELSTEELSVGSLTSVDVVDRRRRAGRVGASFRFCMARVPHATGALFLTFLSISVRSYLESVHKCAGECRSLV